eukprot:6172474-Pleurochrysis_carterae.AAC.1
MTSDGIVWEAFIASAACQELACTFADTDYDVKLLFWERRLARRANRYLFDVWSSRLQSQSKGLREPHSNVPVVHLSRWQVMKNYSNVKRLRRTARHAGSCSPGACSHAARCASAGHAAVLTRARTA